MCQGDPAGREAADQGGARQGVPKLGATSRMPNAPCSPSRATTRSATGSGRVVGIIRRDLRDRPVVVQPGGLLVVETPSRATAGAHYTPRSLAEEVVAARARAAGLLPRPAPDRRPRPLAAHLLRPHPRPQGGRHRLRLRRVPGRRRPLPRRPAGRGLARARAPRSAHRTTCTLQRDPRGRRQLPLRRRHQRHGRRDVQALALAGLARPEAAVLLRRRQGAARQLAARPHRRPAAQGLHIDPRQASPTRRSLFDLDVDAHPAPRPSTCAAGSPPRSTTTTRSAPRPPNAASSRELPGD